MTNDSGNAYYNGRYHQRLHSFLLTEDDYFGARAVASQERLLRGIDRNQGRLLDYGCGMGQNYAGLPESAGYDVSVQARDGCRQRGLRVFDSPDDIPCNAWRVVLCSHVLEHVEQPLEHLLFMKSLLIHNGTLVVVVPRERQPLRSVEYVADIHQHLYAWNLQSLGNLVTRAGFAVSGARCEYVLGYRALLRVRKMLGHRAYYAAAGIVGAVLRCGHLVVVARNA